MEEPVTTPESSAPARGGGAGAPASFRVPSLEDIPAPRGPLRRLSAYLDTIFLDHAMFRMLYPNFHWVSPIMARSNNPLPYHLRWAAARGIRTVINLRGGNPSNWYYLEAEACRRLGLTLVNFPVRSRDVPDKATIHGARALFESIEYPALMHCKSGADRAGLMSALYLLVREGRPLEQATSHLTFWYGHVKQGKTGMIDHFFECYRREGRERGMAFMDWVDTVYDPDAARRSFRSRWWANALVDWILRRE